MAFVRENRLQFSSLRAAGLKPAQTPYGKQPAESRLRLIQKKQEAASCKLEQTRHGQVFGVNFTENSGIQAQGKYNKQPPTAKRTAHRGEAIGIQKGGARLGSCAQGPKWVGKGRKGIRGVAWGRGLEVWTGGVDFWRGARTCSVAYGVDW